MIWLLLIPAAAVLGYILGEIKGYIAGSDEGWHAGYLAACDHNSVDKLRRDLAEFERTGRIS